MNTGSLFSGPGSSSFLSPVVGHILPPAAAPPASAPISAALPPQVDTSPIAQLTPEHLAQFINDLPNMIKGLLPNDQNAFMQLLMTSDIINSLFTNLDNPESKEVVNKLVNTLFDSGLLSQVANDQAVVSEQTQTALKDPLQSKLVQTVLDTNNQFTAKNLDPSQIATASGDGGDTLLPLNIPISQPGTQNQMPQSVATLLADSITNALQLVYTGTPEQATQNPATTTQTLNTATTMLQSLVSNLIALQIANTPGSTVQLLLPTKPDAAGFQTQVDQLSQQLTKVNQEFTKLGEVATEQKWDLGPLKNFLSAPQTLLTQLKSIQPDDTGTFLFIKTFVANSDAVQNAVLTRANETYSNKFEFLKTALFATVAQAPATMVKEQEIRQQQFNQVLQQAPALVNVFKLKDMVGIFEDDVKKKHAALLFAFKRMLFNAAHEIQIVAAGKPTFDYNEVGIFHDLLEPLAQRIEVMLPASAEELSFELMEVISNDIILTFRYIHENEPHKLNDILKRHPRTLLYLRSIESPITYDIQFPRTESLGMLPDAATLNLHFQRIMSVVKKFEKNSEFLKFQPKVLEAFVDEAKYDPQSTITKNSLDIVHKAIADSSGFIDLE